MTATITERDRYGRYLIAPAKGRGKPTAHTRVTTVAKTLDDTHSLTQWKLRVGLKGLTRRSDLFNLACATDLDDTRAFNKIADNAIEAGGGSDRANLGTAIHALCEKIDAGEEVTASFETLADLAAYKHTLELARVEIIHAHTEQILVIDGQLEPVAGTCDRIIRIAGSRPMIADIKTGRSIDYALHSIAIQLAFYANATSTYDTESSTHGKLPADIDKTTGVVIHLPAGEGRCELHLIDLTIGWQLAQLALRVRQAKKIKSIARPLEVLDEAAQTAQLRAHLEARINTCRERGALATLRAFWPAAIPTLKQSTGHTLSDLVVIEKTLDQVDRETEAPF